MNQSLLGLQYSLHTTSRQALTTPSAQDITVGVLTTKFPGSPFMAYLWTIVRAQRNFEGIAWASYDAAYRRQVANRGSFDWSMIDSALYNEAFTGRAKVLPHCCYCLAETHEAKDCHFAPPEDNPQPKRPRLQLSNPSTTNTDRSAAESVEICGLFNRPLGNQCSFKWCRYAHICSHCKKGPHPVAEYTRFTGSPRAP